VPRMPIPRLHLVNRKPRAPEASHDRPGFARRGHEMGRILESAAGSHNAVRLHGGRSNRAGMRA